MNDYFVNFKEDPQVWDTFIYTSAQRSIFTCTKFLESLEVDYDLITVYETGKVVAGAVLIYSDDGIPIEGVFPFTQYQGLILGDNSQRATHSQITREFRVVEYFVKELTNYYKKVCLCHSWRLRDLRAFMWHNYHEPNKGQFRVDLRYTGILNLQKFQQFEDYLSSVRAVRRQEFRKSSQVLRFEFSDDAALLDALHAKTFERQDIERNERDSILVQSICKHAIAGGYGKMSVAWLGEVPISAVLFLYDDRTAYYMFGVNDPLYRNTSAGVFLLMKMIENALVNGFEEVDFVGVNSPNRGDFKIGFNAELKPYFVTRFEL